MRRLVLLAVFASLSLLAGGCMVGPKYAPPVVEQPIGFKSQAGSEASPPVGSSRVDLQACKLEYSIVSPK